MKRNVRRRRALVVAALLLVLGLAVYLTLDRSVFVARDVQVEGNAPSPRTTSSAPRTCRWAAPCARSARKRRARR